MKFWYFLFEGVFDDCSSENNEKGVCSSVLLPAISEAEARELLINSLKDEGIKLIQVDDFFQWDVNDIDMEDENNVPWIEWYEEVQKMKAPVFTPWQVFEPE